MCPYGNTAPGQTSHQMDERLFIHIIEEVKKIGSVRTLSIMLQNEPLLDLGLEQRIRQARSILGDKIIIRTVTNGSLLNKKRTDAFLRSGINQLHVSIDAFTAKTYEKIRPGLPFEEVIKNTTYLVCKAPEYGVSVSVKFLRQEINREEQKDFVNFWSSRGARVSIDTLTHRAGSIEDYSILKRKNLSFQQLLLHPVLNRLIPCCPLPFSSIGILSGGQVVLCCHDWEHNEIIGDISSQNLEEIWNGKRINHHRQLLAEQRADESSICRDCSLSRKFWGN
jgi:radical SAM protein with 4Fe4S-binding SPASM domain